MTLAEKEATTPIIEGNYVSPEVNSTDESFSSSLETLSDIQISGEEDEAGILDHLMDMRSSTEIIVQTLDRLQKSIETVGRRISERSTQLNSANKLNDSDKFVEVYKVMKGVASDTNLFADELLIEVPNFKQGLDKFNSTFMSLISFVKDEITSEDDLESASVTNQSLLSSLRYSLEQIQELKNIMLKTRGKSRDFDRAIRRAVGSLDSFYQELKQGELTFSRSQNMIDELRMTGHQH